MPAVTGLTSERSGATRGEAPALAPSLGELAWASSLRPRPRLGQLNRGLQRCYRQLVRSGEISGLSAIECHAAAFRAAIRVPCPSLASRYRDELIGLSAGFDLIVAAAGTATDTPPPRLDAILDLVDAVADRQHRLPESLVGALQAHGLGIDAVAAIARLVALVGYQARLFPEVGAWSAPLSTRDAR